MNKLDITSKEISSLENMDELFEGYCKKSGITLDFTKGTCCNGYLCEITSEAYLWFLRGAFTAIGHESRSQ